MIANFVVAATENFIKVWDIEFGSLKYKTQLNYKFLIHFKIFSISIKIFRVNSIYLLGNSLSNSFVLSQNNEGKMNIFSLKEGKNISCNWEVCITNL